MAKKRTKMLTAIEERGLLEAYLSNGDIAARNKLVTSYMPLAIRAAEAFARRGTASLQDLTQEAALALTMTIDNFKLDKNARLSTLAPYYIKAALMRHAMDYHGVVRIGTNLPDKRVFMNLRRKVSAIQANNGGMPITDADRAKIAGELKVKVETIKRMEPRIFSTDTVIVTTDVATDDDGERMSMRDGVIAVQGEQPIVERDMDQRQIMGRICAIVEENFDERDLEIVEARLAGDMTQEKFEYLRGKYEISVERIRQIQRGALLTIREALQREGISGIDQIAC